MKYNLQLTEEQARICSKACEFYARIRLGQFEEITWNFLDSKDNPDTFIERRDKAEELLFEARKFIFPDLHGRGHSYGIGKFEDADRAFDIYQVLRVKFGDSRTPFSYHDLPKCTVAQDE